MSLNPSIGHLYHDFSISNAFTALDAKEKFQTRQINAREEKQLGKYNKTLERAKTICKRRHEWEEICIRQQLKAIHSRTPSLDRSLQKEAERRKKYKEHFAKNTSDLLSRNATTFGTRNSVSSYKSQTSNNSSHTHASMFSLQCSNPRENDDSVFEEENEELYDEYRFKTLPSYISTDDNNKFFKRTEHVTRSLDKVYRRHKERTSSNMHAWKVLREDNQDILEKARVYLKNTDTLKMLETVLLVNDDIKNSEENENDSNGAVDTEDTTELTKGQDLVSNEIENDKTDITDVNKVDVIPVELSYKNVDCSDDDSDQIVSSTIANPSVSSVSFSKEQTKWTEIFRMPELWRQYGRTREHLNKLKGNKQTVVRTGRYKTRIKLKDYDNFV